MKDAITYDDFLKLDIRAGMVLSIEPVPKSKKLVKMEVAFGSEIGNRIILGSLAASYEGGLLMVGQKIVAVVNLAPREMMGIVSHGMLLAAHDDKDRVWILNPGPVPDGTEVG